MTDKQYAFFPELLKEVQVPEKGILSRTIFQDETARVILFGFGQGEELSAHTAPVPAMLYFLSGEATLKLGDEEPRPVAPGAFAFMKPHLPHAIYATTPTVMLLVMQKKQA